MELAEVENKKKKSTPSSSSSKKESSSISKSDYEKTRFGHLDSVKSSEPEAAPQEEAAGENIHQSEVPDSTDRGLTLTPSGVSERVKGKSLSSALRDSKSKEDTQSSKENRDSKDPDAFDANN